MNKYQDALNYLDSRTYSLIEYVDADGYSNDIYIHEDNIQILQELIDKYNIYQEITKKQGIEYIVEEIYQKLKEKC